MRKMFIFFAAFWVSFMTIYSVYYYKVSSKLDESVVAEAKDLPNTIIGIAPLKDADKNMVYSEGISQVIPTAIKDSATYLSDVPDTDFVSFNGTYSKAHIEKFYEGLVTKFINHPPIDFKNLKDNDKLLLSYFFENVRLPDGFRVSEKSIDFKGKKIRALQYHPHTASDTGKVTFYKNEKSQEYALKVKINDGKDEVLMYYNPLCHIWAEASTKAKEFTENRENKYLLSKDESVLVPEIDFNIVKDFNKEKDYFNTVLDNYNLVEERIKLKISPPKTGGPLEVNESFNTANNYIMSGNVFYTIRETDKTKPYCVIYVTNPEILKPARVRH